MVKIMNRKTCLFKTLGCKVNQCETQAMMEELERAGFLISGNSKADVHIINTCVVTAKAEKESLYTISKIIKDSPGSEVVVVGCLVNARPEIADEIPGVRFFAGNEDKKNILESPGLKNKVSHGHGGINRLHKRTRAFVKIQDGCNHFCSYYIVPYVGGGERNRSKSEILEEIKRLGDNGCKEIVLTGINLGRYGKEQDGGCGVQGSRNKSKNTQRSTGLIDLIRQVEKIDKIERIGLSSIEPQEIDGSLINLIAGSDKMCKYLHIPLQSGDDETLKTMGRTYTAGSYKDLILEMRSRIPDIAITTDVIAGFPAETEDAFRNSFNFISDMQFAKIHIFRYSHRNGAAASIFGGVGESVKKKRCEELFALAKIQARNYRKCFIGKTLSVLVEKSGKGGYLNGLSSNYIRVFFKGTVGLQNKIVPVVIEGLNEDGVLGSMVKAV